MLKLPKELTADPRHDEVLAILSKNQQLLWTNGKNFVSVLSSNEKFMKIFQREFAFHHICQGLESITSFLEKEQKGLNNVAKKATTPKKDRLSRILFLSSDGSERFYRECDSLLTKYADRMIGCRLDKTGEEFGELLYRKKKLVRAALVSDRKALCQILLTLAK